jgi:hypothetical protein
VQGLWWTLQAPKRVPGLAPVSSRQSQPGLAAVVQSMCQVPATAPETLRVARTAHRVAQLASMVALPAQLVLTGAVLGAVHLAPCTPLARSTTGSRLS